MNATRCENNPIITPSMPGLEGADGENINGPSLIRVPDWLPDPLGRYYLYFAHHNGTHIRLAYADAPEGPWTVYKPGTLRLEQTACVKHVASPDVHVDQDRRQIRMYFHGPHPNTPQVSFVATSSDGIRFTARREVLGRSYFRVFRYGDYHYAVAMNGHHGGVIYRSQDGLTPFETGPEILPNVRHTAVLVEGETLLLFHTIVGEAPERIYLSRVILDGDWKQWSVGSGEVVLEPETDYEGADLELEPSRFGPIYGRVRHLRDPCIYTEAGRTCLLYAVAGESGIAIAKLRP